MRKWICKEWSWARMGEQKQFDFKRATKLRALERIICRGSVKSLLKALDGFARDERTCTVTMKRLSISMGVSPKTTQRTIREAEGEGLLQVTGEVKDGCARTYRINWEAVFELPDGMGHFSAKSTDLTPVNEVPTPVTDDRGPRSICPPTPVNVDRGPRSTLTGVSSTDRTDKVNAAVRQGRTTAKGFVLTYAAADGGGDGTNTFAARTRGATAEGGHPAATSGYAWAGHVDPTFPDAERQRLWDLACSMGYLSKTAVDRVRFRACIAHAKTRPEGMVTGWFVTRLMLGDWGWIDQKHVRNAVDYFKAKGIELTVEEIRNVRTPRGTREGGES